MIEIILTPVANVQNQRSQCLRTIASRLQAILSRIANNQYTCPADAARSTQCGIRTRINIENLIKKTNLLDDNGQLRLTGATIADFLNVLGEVSEEDAIMYETDPDTNDTLHF